MVEAGGQISFFMPLLHRPFRGRTNLRNHRKIVIADEQRVIAGGANIGGNYIDQTPKTGHWRDLSFVLEGPAVIHYSEIFRSDWEFAGGQRLDLHPSRSNDHCLYGSSTSEYSCPFIHTHDTLLLGKGFGSEPAMSSISI